MDQMKIALLSDGSLETEKGGAAIIVDQLRTAYAQQGHSVVFVTTHQDKSRGAMDIAEDSTGKIISLHVDYNLRYRHRRCLGNAETSARLAKVLEHIQPDAVHAHNVHTYLTYDSLRVAKKHTKNIVLTAHDTFLVSFDRIRGPRYEAAALTGKALRLRWTDHLSVAGRKYWPWRNAGIRNVLQETNTNVVAISNATKQCLEANGLSVHSVIPNGISEWQEPPEQTVNDFRVKHHLAGPTVLFAGRIREDKGIICLLDAMETVVRQMPTMQLMINGDSTDIDGMIKSYSPAVQNAVRTPGWLGRDDTMLSYFASTVVTTPSIYLDNFPTINLEAGAAGKPVVGTCFGGTPEAVLHNKTGLIVNPRDTDAFAQALLTLLENTDLQERYGQAAKNHIRTEFALTAQTDRYLDLLSE